MQKLSPSELKQNPFDLIGRQWAMITAKGPKGVNTMTASWGGVGVLWRKEVVYVFLRPQRYTRELMDAGSLFSVCFLPESYRKQMQYCGAHSGRDGDKLAACGFTSRELDGAPVLEQAELALCCKKLYRQPFDPVCFTESALDGEHYPNKDYHILYVGEILGAYENPGE